jgi:hypothetical protein
VSDVTVAEYLHALGEATGHGWGFLAAYGVTWLVCALAWHRWSAKVAAYCTVFQGMVALPLALALTAVGPGSPRPSMPGMDSLSILLSAGQLLGLPVARGGSDPEAEVSGAGRVCLATGVVMLACAAVAVLL